MGWISTISSIAMAIGPPLVYSDQAYTMVKRKDSTGFSIDICGVLIMANITRIYFWLADRFEIALLIQSMLMVVAQIGLLYLCIRYSKESYSSRRNLLPINIWRWDDMGSYMQFIAAFIAVEGVLYFLLHRFSIFVEVLGLVALGLESTLPIPQLITNFRRKSLEGFRFTVLLGWVFGDSFKLVYFFLQANNAWQFKICAAFQLSVDLLICVQAMLYYNNTVTSEPPQNNPETIITHEIGEDEDGGGDEEENIGLMTNK